MKGVVKGVAMIFVLFLLAACGATKPQEPIDAGRVAANKATLEKCRDRRLCIGGFVRIRSTGKILRLDYCETNCSFRTIGINRFVEPTLGISHQSLNDVEITLPDDQNWDTIAIQHARQYVPTRK